jgi:hypothetical protein
MGLAAFFMPEIGNGTHSGHLKLLLIYN